MEQRGSGSNEKEANLKKQAFPIKKIPSKECILEILSFAFYKEEVERLLRMLSKQSREYYAENLEMIDSMKSMISYDFCIPYSLLDMRNL
jgi:hypothetical protein